MKLKHKIEKVKQSKKHEMVPTTKSDKWHLRLFVAGETKKSITALNNLKLICEDKLLGKYNIEVIDLLKNPKLAREHQILAVPTLVRNSPLPVRNIIGDLSNTEQVLFGLDLISSHVSERV